MYCAALQPGRIALPLERQVNHLFGTVPHDRLAMLTQGIGETLSIVVRRRNGGLLSAAAYQHASQAMRAELITAGQVRLRPAEDALVFTPLSLIEQHSINATDALVLRSALDLADTLHPTLGVQRDVRPAGTLSRALISVKLAARQSPTPLSVVPTASRLPSGENAMLPSGKNATEVAQAPRASEATC
jgi:hypothetical protein